MFTFHYDKDLEPLGQKQFVTIYLISKSKHGTFMPTTETMTFNLSFKNPCVDTDFVKIVPPIKLEPYDYIIGKPKIEE
jgi:hypothetical protein